jgi:ABC-2 type transport system permease protein
MFQILSKEFSSFLNTLIAYVVMSVFLTGIGLLMWVFPDTAVLTNGFANMDSLFSLGPYVFIFLIPAITMRSFAEEKKAGTLDLLMTKPLTDWQILLGKFTASVLLVLISLLPTFLYYFSVRALGNPVGNLDTPGIMGSYIGLFMLGCVFCAIGILASSITTNQIIAFITAAFLCFLFFMGFDAASALSTSASQALLLKQFGLAYHYESMSKGLIDSRDIVYFFSVIFLMLSFTKLILGSRQW